MSVSHHSLNVFAAFFSALLLLSAPPVLAQDPAAATTAAPVVEEPDAGASAKIYLKVGEANVKKSLLALPAFQNQGVSNASAIKVGKEIYDVLANDLSVSGYFEFVDSKAFLEDVAKVGLKPATTEAGGFQFETWKQIGAEFLIRVGYRVVDEKVTLDGYIYSVPQQKLALGKSYKAGAGDARVVAHTFANDIVKSLTGKRGFFLSKIVASGSAGPQQKEIFVMDWDGANVKQVTSHKTISISPAWSPDGESVVYTSFAFHSNEGKRNADLFQFELSTGKRWLLSHRPGINSGASFFPDGKNVLLTVSQSGNPDIFKMALDGKTLVRVTEGPRGAMNVEPVPSPDGKKILFSSDRGGTPTLYVMNADGSDVKRLPIPGKYNATPSWSPDGTRIAFAGYDSGNFDVFVTDLDGTRLARLTSAKKSNGKMANNESPTWSPDGRLILFASDRTGTSQLYVVTPDGVSERRITFDKRSYFKPKWSPHLD